MKRIFCLFGIAAMALSVVMCKPEEKPGPDVNNITEDGFYVVGEATGLSEVTAALTMANGINEANNQTPREGMYEKYIVLQSGKDFTLAYVNGGQQTAYGATLSEFKADLSDPVYDSNPADAVFKGKLVVGDSAPKMTVSKTGLYHIVLDLNKAGDLDDAQIVLCPVTMGVRGGMNSWGFDALEASTPSNDGITFTLSGQEMAAGAEFKFAYNSAWKITLDKEGKVKANTNLGQDCKPGGGNIAVTEGAGAYKITLTYKLAAGDIANSFSYKTELESASSAPETMYMIGQQFGDWKWEDPGVVELSGIPSGVGYFWCTRYFEADKGFKFCSTKAWNGDFTGAGTAGYTVNDGNCWVPADGFYTVFVNGNDNSVEVYPAEVYGIGSAWGNDAWDFNAPDIVKFQPDGKTLKATVTNTGEVRISSKILPSAPIDGLCTPNGWLDWWKTEFIFFDGKIAYRGAGGDQERVTVEAGKTIVLDFNAGTAEVVDGGTPPAGDGIKTAEEFIAWLADPSKDIELGADIDLTGKSVVPATEFKGNLDGKGKTITVKDLTCPLIPLTSGSVKNVTFAGSFSATPGDDKLLLAPIGKSTGEIENVTNKATVTVTGAAGTGGATLAGVVAEAYGPVKGCKNEAKISANASGKDTWSIVVAGVAGFVGAPIEGCDNSGEVSLVAGSPLGRTKGMTEISMKYDPVSSVAGVVAYAVSDADHAVTVKDCNNTGKISFTYDGLHSASSPVSRSAVCGVVANTGGDVTNCHNKGEIHSTMVAPDRSTAFSAPNIILHASGVTGVDYFVKKIKNTTDDQNETSVIDCTNSGNIYADSDLTASNNTVGGISAWPAGEKASVTVIKNCVNSGNIYIKGLLKVRVGGIAGGTNSIEDCKNTGNIEVENADAASVFGLINGFHTQTHTLKNCEATGTIKCAVAVNGLGGLCGGIGNVENTVCEGCKVNATIESSATEQVGLIVGHLNGNSKNITIGTTDSPVKVAGTLNGVKATSNNFKTLLHHAKNYKEGVHTFNAVFGE